MLKLSEDLQRIAESGDVGNCLAGYAERAAALEQQRALLLNLLAIIHRDGGHHTLRYGVLQSAKEAEIAVCAERVECSNLREQLAQERRRALTVCLDLLQVIQMSGADVSVNPLALPVKRMQADVDELIAAEAAGGGSEHR